MVKYFDENGKEHTAQADTGVPFTDDCIGRLMYYDGNNALIHRDDVPRYEEGMEGNYFVSEGQEPKKSRSRKRKKVE